VPAEASFRPNLRWPSIRYARPQRRYKAHRRSGSLANSLCRPGHEKQRAATAVLQRSVDHRPVPVKQLAMNLPSGALQEITWRESTARPPGASRLRKSCTLRRGMVIDRMAAPWSEPEPAKYWLATLPAATQLKALVKMAKHR
jgi:SRSO17 transposase